MKLNNILSLSLLLFSLLICSCGNDDDNSGGDGNPDTTISCCEIPHLEACAGGAKVFVPNAFTPNANGFNDIFLPFGGLGIKQVVSFKIFDENNSMVFDAVNFQINNPDFGWDGSLNNGTLAGDGVYSYTLTIENIADEQFDFEGSVCVRSSLNPLPCVDFEKHCVYGTQHNGEGDFDPTLPRFEDCQ